MSDASNPFRRRVCAGALLLTPGLTLLGHLVQASPAAHDTASELASVAAHPGRATMSALIGFVALSDRYESSALVGLWVGLMLLGYTLGPVVLGVALWRSGGSWLIPAALIGGVVLMMVDAGRYPLAAGFACTWLGLATAGVSLLREPTTGRLNPRSVPSSP